MKKLYALLLLFLLLASSFSYAQNTENFEDETLGSATFTSSGQEFTIASTTPPFLIDNTSPNASKCINNLSGDILVGTVQLTINSGFPFILEKINVAKYDYGGSNYYRKTGNR